MTTTARAHRSLTVRERILATVLALTALALLVAGGTAFALQRARVDQLIDASLARTTEEVRALAADGVDPRTGTRFRDADALLYTFMQREVPAANEGMVAFVGETLRYRTQDVGLDLHTDPQLIAAVRDASAQTRYVPAESLRTERTEYRYRAVPVRVGDATPGALVLAFDRTAEQSQVADTFRTYALVAAASLLVLAAAAWVLAGRLLRPVRALREAAEQISDTDLSRRIPVTGTDDLSELTRTVNDMLARLETSFRSQRLLLDDAGHELRTPITIVRGHLELMDPADPEDAAATRELALSELDRMHRLADDLVLLAKAEQPDFVRLETVDVGELCDNVLGQARQLGERRWRLEERVEAVAPLDAQRITQALLQLAANAVRFSAEGSTIELGSAVRDGELLLWVQDEGIGIPASETTRIFERFARVASPHAPRTEGSGLGLSIVAAIAAGHGGRVSVVSVPGAGSRFTLHVPAPSVTPPSPQEP
ncbi:HAMP domain-containing sensor histidine kinase [Georgenia sp. MJ206]|uniref:sensor histidine kinase n=1 Tax=Georgenia wangjunii TaxID=3117730 RepID=UPI002F25F224